MIKKLLLLFFLFTIVVLLYYGTHIRHPHGPAVSPIKDQSALSLKAENKVQSFLTKQSLIPSIEQNHLEQKEGTQWTIFYKKFRVSRNDSLSDLEEVWKTLDGTNGLKVWEIGIRDQEKPRAKILDIKLGTDALITHHFIFVQYLKPQVALIIDDMGYDGGDRTERLLNLGVTLNLSVIPGTPHGQKVADQAFSKGDLVMLHMPMEPLAYPKVNPGPWGIYVKENDDEIRNKLEKALAWVPHAQGFNNHMGSRATADRRVMQAALSVAQKHGIFFVDSLTDSKSVGHTVAQEMRIPYAVRDVFLDDEASEGSVKKRLIELARQAKKKGYAVGIGHPRPATVKALEKIVPELLKQGIEFVAVKELVHSRN